MSSGKVKKSEMWARAKSLPCIECFSNNIEVSDGTDKYLNTKCLDCGHVCALHTTGRMIDDMTENK